jgi:acetyl-CoA carboxylase biotin carboxyl carrier protein
MDAKEIQELVSWLIERDISDFEMNKNGMHLRVRRRGAGEPPEVISGPSEEAPPPPSTSAPKPPTGAEDANLAKVTSPLVGTFYRRPNPKAEAFVEVGSRVEKGQTLCVVEAMKVMNEISASHAGEVTAIHVKDGEPVEFGETLFSIKTA